MTEKERKHEEYLFFKARGICPCCRKSAAAIGHVMCAECMEKQTLRDMKQDRAEMRKKRQMIRERRVANGTCYSCGGRPAEEGHKLCAVCLLKRRQYQRAHYVKKIKPDGACLRCDLPAMEGKKYCAEHQREMEIKAAHMRTFCVKSKQRQWNQI